MVANGSGLLGRSCSSKSKTDIRRKGSHGGIFGAEPCRPPQRSRRSVLWPLGHVFTAEKLGCRIRQTRWLRLWCTHTSTRTGRGPYFVEEERPSSPFVRHLFCLLPPLLLLEELSLIDMFISTHHPTIRAWSASLSDRERFIDMLSRSSGTNRRYSTSSLKWLDGRLQTDMIDCGLHGAYR